MYVKWKTLLNQGTPMAAKRRAETAQENREKMIQAGRKAFAEKGYAAASMDELTASVGLTRGALYHNFTDKKGLLAAAILWVILPTFINTDMALSFLAWFVYMYLVGGYIRFYE